jgi:hypothetical protein
MSNSLIQDVETFLSRSGMNPSDLGREAMNDPNFVFDLRAGRDVRMSTAEKLRLFMKQKKGT